MQRPLIAVVAYHLEEGRVTRWESAAFAVPEPYVEAVLRAGAEPAILAPREGGQADLLDRFDGLMLIGGGDVVPGSYGASERHPAVYGTNHHRDAFEMGLVLAADATGVPMLAICRGAQVVNVAFGGTLHQHLPDLGLGIAHGGGGAPGSEHKVEVAESSRLAESSGRATLSGLSHHHQGLDRLGRGLIPVAWSEDGLVEAVERPDGWLVAVQWHPEETASEDPGQQALFDAFVERARARGQT
jgi:putative glutamine amidotransferase